MSVLEGVAIGRYPFGGAQGHTLAMIATMDRRAGFAHEARELSPQAEAIRSILVGENASAARVLIDGVRFTRPAT